jgi:hypothetical protein
LPDGIATPIDDARRFAETTIPFLPRTGSGASALRDAENTINKKIIRHF